MVIVLLGGPGAGKGTLAEGLIEKYNMQHFSTGDLLREAVANDTDAGKQAKQYMEAGDLVPDEVMLGIVKDNLASLDDKSSDVILDGFPRTTAQAESLDEMLKDLGLKVDIAFLLNCTRQVVIDRICNRRTCENCGYIGNLNWIDNDQWDSYKCPECGHAMVQRKDDNEETVLNRIDVYNKQTEPLVDYYKNSGLLVEVDATVSADNTLNEVSLHLN